MPSLWFVICLDIFLTGFSAVADLSKICRYRGDTMGICKPYIDCTQLYGAVIFPNMDCKQNEMCCPSDFVSKPKPIGTVSLQKPLPAIMIPTTTLTPPSTALPKTINEYTTQSPVATEYQTMPKLTTKLPIKKKFTNILHPHGLEILKSQNCGRVQMNSRNLNSSNVEADILEFPWMALLEYENLNGEKEFACGGSLIASRWVLTAASCIKPNLIGLRLGEYNILAGTTKDCVQNEGVKRCTNYVDMKILEPFTHPDFDKITLSKDIALIKLTTRVEERVNIKPICLPIEPVHFNTTNDERRFIIAGWKSKTGDRGESSTILKKHIVKPERFFACLVTYPSMDVETNDSNMCLSGTDDDELSICSGDPGSPVFCLTKDKKEFYMQLGIVPFGMDECGEVRSIPYFVENVSESMNWITGIIAENS